MEFNNNWYEKIQAVQSKYDLLTQNYIKNYILYKKNPTNNEYNQILANNTNQIQEIIREVESIKTELQKEKNVNLKQMNKLNTFLKEKENIFYKNKNTNISSKKLLNESSQVATHNILLNYTYIFGCILILFSLFYIRKTVLGTANTNTNNPNFFYRGQQT